MKNTDLRKRAEQATQDYLISSDDYLPVDVKKLIEELHIHQIELELQNAELRKREAELETANLKVNELYQQYVNLYDFAPVGYCALDTDGFIQEINLTGAKQLGKERDIILNTRLYEYIAEDDRDIFFTHLRKTFETQDSQSCELRLIGKNGAPFHARFETIAVVNDKENRQCRTAISDITDIKKAEEQIKAALEQKKRLIREIHHRVKNNLMSVNSLILMQQEQAQDSQARAQFHDLRNRVMAMSMVHKNLYQFENYDQQINVGEYLENLVDNIGSGFSCRFVSVQISAQHFSLPADKATACGMITTELLTNAFKHAFPVSFENDKRPEIRIEFKKDWGICSLIVSDNGKGISSEIDWNTTKSLGLELVRSWALHQLNGSIEADTKNGTMFTIRFSV